MYSTFCTFCHNIAHDGYACDSLQNYLDTNASIWWDETAYTGTSPNYKIPVGGGTYGVTSCRLDLDGSSHYFNQTPTMMDTCSGGDIHSYNEFTGRLVTGTTGVQTWFSGTSGQWTAGLVTEKISVPTDHRVIIHSNYAYNRSTSGNYTATPKVRWQHINNATSGTARKITLTQVGGTGINDYNPFDPHLIIMTVDGDSSGLECKVYVDGTLELTSSQTWADWGSFRPVDCTVYFGDDDSGDTKASHMFVYQYVIDDDEALDIYNAYKNNFDPPLS